MIFAMNIIWKELKPSDQIQSTIHYKLFFRFCVPSKSATRIYEIDKSNASKLEYSQVEGFWDTGKNGLFSLVNKS